MRNEIRFAIDDGVARITLDRDERMNAITAQMIADMIEILDETDRDDRVRAVVLTGEGRAFCAGADLGAGSATFDFTDRSTDPESVEPDMGGLFTLRAFRSLKPLIGAVNGAAVGFGASMLLPLDFRVASEKAKFGFVFAARGIVPDGAASWFLPKIVGVPKALDWCLTGRIFDADEALEAGLVSAVVPPDRLTEAATEIAHRIATSVAPVSAALTRQMIWQFSGAEHPMAAHRVDSRAIQATGRGADAAEGVRAFLEKRPAQWTLQPSQDMPDWYPWAVQPEFTP